jgi:glycosyltransferase involved in cell wall biosynthesis
MIATVLGDAMLGEITPVLLALNEAPNIARTVSALSWAKDIVVVDSGSTDNTLGILKRFPNVRIFSRPFDSHANQWRYAVTETAIATPWILRLDADYQLTPELIEELRALNVDTPVNAYRHGSITRFLGANCMPHSTRRTWSWCDADILPCETGGIPMDH